MRVPLGWLSEWIDLPGSVEDLGERLTMGGIELEEVLRSGPDGGFGSDLVGPTTAPALIGNRFGVPAAAPAIT